VTAHRWTGGGDFPDPGFVFCSGSDSKGGDGENQCVMENVDLVERVCGR
jgi:hypothetical protein